MKQQGVSTSAIVTEMNQVNVTPEVNVSLGKKVIAAAFAIALASVVIGATGFAPGYAHNAAHDTRHVMVFPCH